MSDEEVAKIRQADYNDAESFGDVALNVFTNYFNTVAQTDVNFPKSGKSAAAPS